MKKLILLTFSTLSLTLSAQFSGYIGKRNLIDAGINIQVPAIYDYLHLKANDYSFYQKEGAYLVDKVDKINPGARLSYLRLVGEHFGMGLDLNFDAINTRMVNYDDDPNDDFYSYGVRNEALQFRSFTINPKLEFSSREGLLPVGISHQFGFGIRLISLVEKDYLYESMESSGWSYTMVYGKKNYSEYFTTTRPNRFIYKSINYTLNYRKPLSDRMLMNFSFRYALNIGKSLPDFYYGTSTFQDHIYMLLNKQQFCSILQFNMGVSYAL